MPLVQFEKDSLEMERLYLPGKEYTSGYKDFPTAPRPLFLQATPVQPAVKILSGKSLFSAGSLKTM